MNTTHSSSSSPSTPLPCPRCKSNDTKFCYYNNYNLMQPRHFCRSCRRYWTHGGTLRNVPVGGGSRKTKQADQIAQTNSNSKPKAVAYDSLQNHTSWNPNPCFQVLNAQTPVGGYGYLRQQCDVEPTSHFENDREELGFDSGMNQYELDPLPESLSVNGSPFCYWK